MTKTKNQVSPSYASIFKAIEEKANNTKFGSEFIATQITLTGDGEFQPLYIKVEDSIVETAPYEYRDASFYIDIDTACMADVLNGKKTIYDAIAEGLAKVNGDASKAILFVHTFLG